MPRANLYWVNGAAYHLTHRCHNRAFLLQRVSNCTGREPRWTESIAVGHRDFIERAETQLLAEQARSRTTRMEEKDGTWILRETAPNEPYGVIFTPH